ncbi:MAG TPA: MarR family winged helix-turn-helix transcriptional regulator [Mycobacteriales bacterium]|nr:MarR family winged helix-turn-helix transcriptional regulator [Mycobacteriales bacterium]
MRSEQLDVEPDLGVATVRLMRRTQRRLMEGLAREGFAEIRALHGAVLAFLDTGGVRATELARLSGQRKQVIGAVVDELEELGYVRRAADPRDRRAKLVVPTERGQAEIAAADRILAGIERDYRAAVGARDYRTFRAVLHTLVTG